MDSIFRGDVNTARGRALAWVDSLFIDHAVFRLIWGNLSVVAPGKLYRCNHPTPQRLRRMQRTLGIHTVINLRGKTQSVLLCWRMRLRRNAKNSHGSIRLTKALKIV